MRNRLLFLCYGSPWPPYSGGALRTIGLLTELSKRYKVELLILTSKSLNINEEKKLKKYSTNIIQIPQIENDLKGKLKILWHMMRQRVTYHCAVIELSISKEHGLSDKILGFSGVIFTDAGHWGVLVKKHKCPNWILNQSDADVQFWYAYAKQTDNFLVKIAALVNWQLAKKTFKLIYPNVGRIISVCHEDKVLTSELAPSAIINVIENGVDCKVLSPNRENKNSASRILFTGTSATRNVVALRKFVKEIMPQLLKKIPDIELIVGGNFSPDIISEFSRNDHVFFSGKVEDMRPLFNESDVFIAPFQESHGSKLKISEAMAMGMAIVAYREGARGFDLVDEFSISIANTTNDFAEKVIDLLTNVNKRQKMGENARLVAERTLDWKILGEELFLILESHLNTFKSTKKIL